MAKTKISEFDSNPNNNTDIDSINIAEGCAPSGINNAIRELMSQLKDFQTGAQGDSFNGPVNGTVGATTPAAGTFTTLSTTGNTTLGDDAGDVITINGSTAFGAGAGITGNLTLSSGTANGVAYLNGSKVLTSGSALTFDGTNLGIGVAASNAFEIGGRGNSVDITTRFLTTNASGSSTRFQQIVDADTGLVTFGSDVSSNGSGNGFAFTTSNTERMRLTSTGLGIGTSSPSTPLHVVGAITGSSTIAIGGTPATGGTVRIPNGGSVAFRNAANSANLVGLSVDSSNNLTLREGNVVIDSSGNLLVGTTTTYVYGSSGSGSVTGWDIAPNGGGNIGMSADVTWNRYTTGSVHGFRYNGSPVGAISISTTATTYATSSDYRLKEDIQPMTGALAKVAALKPCTYKWKADGSDGEGFIAHELAEVVPQCVTGEKDAVDAEGKPVYQGIDTSFLVATLTAALQEQQAQIEQLRAEIQTLKGN